MSAPVIVDGIVGLAIFGNTSEIYLAHVPDKGGEVYSRLGSVKATTYIHGTKDVIKDSIKIMVSIVGGNLIGFKIDAWVNGKTNQSALFNTRDLLNAIALLLAFDDTTIFVGAAGPEAAAAVVLAETYVKVGAGCLHIAAVVNE
jgi:hypothetical protein